VADAPSVKTHPVRAARIAVMHTWLSTQDEGWYRIGLDQLQVPFAYISTQDVSKDANLKSKYDVILFAPVGRGSQAIINGMPMYGNPLPWKKTQLTPNLGNTDETDDMRPGLGWNGLQNLQKFVKDGGLFITVDDTSDFAVNYGFTAGVSVNRSQKLRAVGVILRTKTVDSSSPIAYGYEAGLPLYFNQTPLFQVAAGGGGGFGGGGGEGGPGGGGGGANRASGRGGVNDPDIIQAMPQPRPLDPANRPNPDQVTAEQRESPFFVPPQLRPRVVMRFGADEKTLLISGMLAGASELANRPAVVDVPVGRGHVVMFATNPMWRHQTQGEFFLIFNAALNYDNLSVGRSEDRAAAQRPSTDYEDQ